MKWNYLVVEGNIGSGKTTLAHKLAMHYQGRLLLEQFADNPFLPLFYKDKARYAFPLELSFLAERYQQQQETLLNRDLFQEVTIADYIWEKSQLFARVNLNEAEYSLFQRMADIMKANLPKPDLILFLHTPVYKLQQQIKARGRTYEQTIEDSYLKTIEAAYMQFLEQTELPVLRLDMTHVDINRPGHLEQLIDFLEKQEEFKKQTIFIQ